MDFGLGEATHGLTNTFYSSALKGIQFLVENIYSNITAKLFAMSSYFGELFVS